MENTTSSRVKRLYKQHPPLHSHRLIINHQFTCADMEMNREINISLKCTTLLLFDNDRQMFYTSEHTQTRDVFRILS